jgi:hypothetical protein
MSKCNIDLETRLEEMEKFQNEFEDTSLAQDLRGKQKAFREGFSHAWLEKEEEIKNLKKQIEKLKNGGNCQKSFGMGFKECPLFVGNCECPCSNWKMEE